MTEPGSSDRFGYEWARYSTILPEHEAQFLAWTAPLKPEEWRGKNFLDAGCGMGRNSFWPMRYGASSGLAIDTDERSLAAARRNLSSFSKMRIERMSLYDLPYEKCFDFVFSIGVIHHLEDPENALSRLVRAAKPGGSVLIWVYGRENNGVWLFLADPLRKWVFSRLPIRLVHALSLIPTAALWIFVRLGVGPSAYSAQLTRLRFAHLRAIVFDQMLPRIANYWSRAAVQELMERAGLTNVTLRHVNDLSWSAVGTRP